MNSLKVKDITLIALMVAVIEVSKLSLSSIPNVELVSFWIIIFSLYFDKKVYYVIAVFVLLEGMLYGVHVWWIMYLYGWPLLAFLTIKLKNSSMMTFVVLSGVFGLLFGLLCSLPYFFIGLSQGSLMNGIQTAFAWWVAGIPFDMIHGISNIVVMVVLYYPLKRVMDKYIVKI